MAPLASRFDVHARRITQWKQQLMAHAAAVFASDGVWADGAPTVDVALDSRTISTSARSPAV